MSLLNGIDISNWQGSDISALLQQYQPQHVVVRLSTESLSSRQIAIDQLHAAVDFGATVSGYVWCYWNSDPASEMLDAIWLAYEARVPLDLFWLDVEDENNVPAQKCDEWLSIAVDQIEKAGKRAGIYTGKYFWEANVADWPAFTRLPLWLAHYDSLPTLSDSLLPVGAWTTLAGKQYYDKPIDQDVFDSYVISPAPADLCAGLRAAIITELQKSRLSRKRLLKILGQ